MNTVGLTVPQLRLYYRETLSGDGVCTITEDEFVVEYQHFKAQGKQIALAEFMGLPASVDMERSFMISDAQKIGQKTYQTVIVIEGQKKERG
jgi:hypothetical protein